MLASRAAIGTELVTTVSSRSDGNVAAIRPVVVPASSSTVAPLEQKESSRGRGDGVLVLGAGVLAFTDTGLDERAAHAREPRRRAPAAPVRRGQGQRGRA